MTDTRTSLIEELDLRMAELAENLFAIAQGNDRQNIVEQIQLLASALSDYRNVEGVDPPMDEIVKRLRSLELPK
jgi:hypothetical protein